MLQQIIFIAKKSTVGFPIFLSHANPDSLCSLIFFFSVGPIADHYFGELNITPMDGAPKYVKGKPTAVFSWLLVGGLFDPLCWCKSRPRCSSNIRAPILVLLVTSLVKYMSSLLLVENGLVAGSSVRILHHYVTMCEYL